MKLSENSLKWGGNMGSDPTFGEANGRAFARISVCSNIDVFKRDEKGQVVRGEDGRPVYDREKRIENWLTLFVRGKGNLDLLKKAKKGWRVSTDDVVLSIKRTQLESGEWTHNVSGAVAPNAKFEVFPPLANASVPDELFANDGDTIPDDDIPF